MGNALTLLGVGVAAGLVVAIAGSPLIYAFWRARNTAMLASNTFNWSRTLITSTLVVVPIMVIVAALILPDGKFLGLLGGTLVAGVTAVTLWRGVIVLARAQESRQY
jgi:hypothetical protein